jgi:hypothetical protein
MKAPPLPLSSRADDLAAGEVMKPMNRGMVPWDFRSFPPNYNPLDWHNLQICSLGAYPDFLPRDTGHDSVCAFP